MSETESKKFYITTTLPYVNSDPHIGFAMELIRADVIARYKKLQGFTVFFNTGSDEHGQKIFQKALEAKKDTQEYVNEYADKFKALIPLLHISEDIVFTRTTDAKHIHAAQEFWKICNANGFIYKKNYQTKYCIGCELEKSDSELVDGVCPLHPNLPIELRDEENYFFKFSAFQQKLLDLYESHPNFVIPETRFHEIKTFVKNGLQDFSISRLKNKMAWGIEVPNDPEQVMYVWFDALVSYISAIGWPDDLKTFETWHNKECGMVQYCGKDNLRQQSAMWQAMLMAAHLPNSQKIIINGFVTGAGGVKMSKSLGNTITPEEIVSEYGTDAVRYYVLREMSPFEDPSFTKEGFQEAYNANLANGLGNLVSRIMTMAENNNIATPSIADNYWTIASDDKNLDAFDIQSYANEIWDIDIKSLDWYIQDKKPFQKIKIDRASAEEDIKHLLIHLTRIASKLEPILPETSEKILTLIKANKKPETPLFARKD